MILYIGYSGVTISLWSLEIFVESPHLSLTVPKQVIGGPALHQYLPSRSLSHSGDVGGEWCHVLLF